MAITAPKSYDTSLTDLLGEVDSGKLQLPEFQRNWTWDDERIVNIIASLTQGYPMGALMQLQCGGDFKLKYRPFEGAAGVSKDPDNLVLDGQQRLTSLYCALYAKGPVKTKNIRGQAISRYYYLDMRKCLDPDCDRADAVLSIPDTRKVTEDIGRTVVLDLSTREREIAQLMFPVNLIFDNSAYNAWFKQFAKTYGFDSEEYGLWESFEEDVVKTVQGYKVPVITLLKETPREAVCKVFENVNTGGVSLTVFELVTASFATYDFDLRGNWEKTVRPKILGGYDGSIVTDLMEGVDATAFLTSMTLFTTFKKKMAGSGYTRCKKKDVLALGFDDYQANLDALVDGFEMARDFLIGERIFRMRDLPYTTQIIPLAATCAYIGRKRFSSVATKNVLRRWLWCGIFGEMYGGANETRYANDIEDLVDQRRPLPGHAAPRPADPQQRGLQGRYGARLPRERSRLHRRRADDQRQGRQHAARHPPHLPTGLLREGGPAARALELHRQQDAAHREHQPHHRRIRPSASACRWGFRPNFYCQDDPNAGNWGESHLTARVGTRLTPTVGAILDQQCVLGRSERGELGRREEPKRPGISLSHEESWVWSSEMRGIRVVAIPDGMVSKCRGRFPRLFSYGGVWESRASS